jgi:hypothetical protein
MMAGFRPVRDIVASQGPLSLDVTYPLFATFGADLRAARLAVVVYALLGIVAVYSVGRMAGGRLAGIIAALLLALSPTFLENSRAALVEVPALVPAVLAVAAALRYRTTGSASALIGSFLLLCLAVLVKPLVVPAAAPVLAATLPRARRCPAVLLLAFSLAGGLALAVVLMVGPVELYEQVLLFRLGSWRQEGWSLSQNWTTLVHEIRWEGAGWLGLVALAVALSLWQRRTVLLLLLWVAASLGLLLVYSPLLEKHAVVLIPPAALLVGATLAQAIDYLRSARTAGARRLLGAALGAGAVAYLASTPAIVARDQMLSITSGDARHDVHTNAVQLLAALTGPDEFVVVDEPYVAFLARRKVPPGLADPTSFRLRSRTLSGSAVIAAVERYQVKAMLLWTDGLADLKPFGEWVDKHFRAIKIYERSNRKDRTMLLRANEVTESARLAARDTLTPRAVDFGDQLRLAASGLAVESVRPGGSVAVDSEWEALSNIAVNYHVLAVLRAADGRTVAQAGRSLGSGTGTVGWQPGQWLVRHVNLVVPPRTRPGEYQVFVALYDTKSGETLPLVSPPRSGPDDEAAIGTIRVR